MLYDMIYVYIHVRVYEYVGGSGREGGALCTYIGSIREAKQKEY